MMLKRMCGRISWLACLTVLLSGCATSPRIEAKRDTSYTDKLERVLIVYHNEDQAAAQLGPKFSRDFLVRFQEVLGHESVPSLVVRPNKNEVDQDVPVRAAVADFRPRQALHFGLVRMASATTVSPQTYSSTSKVSHEKSLAFGFSLYDVTQGKTVWRGEMQYFHEPDAKSVADRFVEKLKAERLLGWEPPGSR